MMQVLNISRLSKSYRRTNVLQGLDLSLDEGYILGLVGENGAGKTTLIKSILNLVRIDSGRIEIFGKAHDRDERQLRAKIGFVHESSYLFPDLRLSDIEHILKAAYPAWDSLRFRRYLDRLQIPLDKRVKTFSKGMQMRAALAIALSHDAELILMDEPTSGLDPKVRHDLYRLIREEMTQAHRTFIISTHITSDLEQVADHVAILRNGRISLNLTLEELREEYAICKGANDLLDRDSEDLFIGVQMQQFGFRGLTNHPDRLKRLLGQKVLFERPTIEDLLIFTDTSDSSETAETVMEDSL